MAATAGMATPGERDLGAFMARNATYGSSERYTTATRAEAYYLGLQYKGLAEWGTRGVPLRKKQPSITVPLYRETIEALVGFVWCGHRFPRAIVGATRDPDDDDEDGESEATEPSSEQYAEGDDDEIGPILGAEDAKALTTFLTHAIRCGFLERSAKEATRKALVGTSCAVIIGLRAGYPSVAVEPGKHCTPTFADDGRSVASLDICYQIQKEMPTGGGGIRKRWFWYRRVIDAMTDTTFVEVPVVPGVAPNWQPDPQKTVAHNLGFCPARWWKTLPDSADALDGTPVIDPSLYPLLDAVNYTLSQRNRAVQYGCDPQLVRRGVEKQDREALDKNPGIAWDISSDSDVSFLEAQGTGVERANEHLDDLTARFRAACRVVSMDPKLLGGDISGRFLEIIHDPMAKLASDLRADLGDDGFCGVLQLLLRIVAVVVTRGEDVWIPGAKKAAAILTQAQLAGPWLDPPVSLAWPPFFEESAQESQLRVQTAVLAMTNKLITPETAVKSIADAFPIEDAGAEIDALEEDREEAQAKADAIGAGNGANSTGTPDDDGDEKTDMGGNAGSDAPDMRAKMAAQENQIEASK